MRELFKYSHEIRHRNSVSLMRPDRHDERDFLQLSMLEVGIGTMSGYKFQPVICFMGGYLGL